MSAGDAGVGWDIRCKVDVVTAWEYGQPSRHELCGGMPPCSLHPPESRPAPPPTAPEQQAKIEALADAVEGLLSYAENWLADLRIEKRESEQEGFHSSEVDKSEENGIRHIEAARTALRAAGRLP